MDILLNLYKLIMFVILLNFMLQFTEEYEIIMNEGVKWNEWICSSKYYEKTRKGI